jgi:hypothetical protein
MCCSKRPNSLREAARNCRESARTRSGFANDIRQFSVHGVDANLAVTLDDHALALDGDAARFDSEATELLEAARMLTQAAE